MSWIERFPGKAAATGRKIARRVIAAGLDTLSAAQLRLSRARIAARSRRVALEQWVFALDYVPLPRRGVMAIVAFRTPIWVEWAVHAAFQAYRAGFEPIIMYSGREIRAMYRFHAGRPPADGDPIDSGGADFWSRARQVRFLKFLDLDALDSPPCETGAYEDMALQKASAVVAHDLRVEETEAEREAGNRYPRRLAQAREMLRSHALKCERALRAVGPQRAICPSGLIGWSIAFHEAARRMRIPTVFVETWLARPGHMIWNLDRPALDFDVEGWVRASGPWDAGKERLMGELLAFREDGRRPTPSWLHGARRYQRGSHGVPLPGNLRDFLLRPGTQFLLGTNVVGDSATLGRATIFPSQAEWLARTCRFFKDHPELNLIIRIHPDEAVIKWVRRRMCHLAHTLVADAPNIFLVHASEDTNTYSIIERIDVGLVWVSNLGVDLALRGKPVLLAAGAAYAQLGIGTAVRSQEEYFRRVLQLAVEKGRSDEHVVEKCKAYQLIFSRDISLRVGGAGYFSGDYRIEPVGANPELDRFYGVLFGDLDDKGRPREGPCQGGQIRCVAGA
jgi:hypothetical protein